MQVGIASAANLVWQIWSLQLGIHCEDARHLPGVLQVPLVGAGQDDAGDATEPCQEQRRAGKHHLS